MIFQGDESVAADFPMKSPEESKNLTSSKQRKPDHDPQVRAGPKQTETKLGAQQQIDQVTPTIPHGSLVSHAVTGSPSAVDAPIQLKSYNKGGYSVVITGGILCCNSDEKGIFMMKSGTEFVIAIGNNNKHAAEVDITFGEVYLGVWLVEANRDLFHNPLLIEGSSWAPGRLKYFSVSDDNKPTPSDLFGPNPKLNGQIILEFKPEVLMLKLFVKHVWKDGEKEVLMPDFQTATIGALKERIKKICKLNVSCLILGGKKLPEDKTMSSHAMENTNEVIQVLYEKEELEIHYSGKVLTMIRDPSYLSLDDVKGFIQQEFNIPKLQQDLRFNGEKVEETEGLFTIFVKSKEKPVIRVCIKEISIKVFLPDESSHKFTINWFATVNDLKEKLQKICETVEILKFNDDDISEEESKTLFELKFQEQNTVYVQTRKTQAYTGNPTGDFGARKRGFGSGRTRGFVDHPAGSSTLRVETDNIQLHSVRGSSRRPLKEGVVMLCGNKESVYRKFRVDKEVKEKWKFSKEKAVILTIQLIDHCTGASTATGSCLPIKG